MSKDTITINIGSHCEKENYTQTDDLKSHSDEKDDWKQYNDKEYDIKPHNGEILIILSFLKI